MTAQPLDDSNDPMIGKVLSGLYRVQRLLGEGGMGRVYEAVHVHLDKRYAVKVLGDARTGHPAAAERLLREARAASKIDHENIAKAVNFDTDADGRVYIVMELIDGPSLGEALKGGPMPEERACRITVQVASALQAAHDAGVLHRDLKPDNVILSQTGDRELAKVLDFGISKISAGDQTDVKLTATDQILGTPLYISPELARGAAQVDHRADIYALGAMLYEMLTGRPPFVGDNQFQLLFKHGSEAPLPPGQRDTHNGISPHVERAVMRALAKDPDDRFASMREFAEALSQPHAAPPPSRGAHKAWIAAILAAVGVAGWALWQTSDRVEVPDDSGAVTEVSTPEPETKQPETEQPPALPAEQPLADAGVDNAQPQETVVVITSRPAGAKVRINGESVGATPFRHAYPLGTKLSVRWASPGYRAWEQEAEVVEGLVIHKNLSKRPAEPPPQTPIKLDF